MKYFRFFKFINIRVRVKCAGARMLKNVTFGRYACEYVHGLFCCGCLFLLSHQINAFCVYVFSFLEFGDYENKSIRRWLKTFFHHQLFQGGFEEE